MPHIDAGSSEVRPGLADLVELCVSRAAETPDQQVFSLLGGDLSTVDSLTAAELDRRARAVAVALRRRAEPGSRVLLAFAPGLDFIPAFFGCLYAGMTAVPIPPLEAGRSKARDDRFASVRRSAQPSLLLSTAAELGKLAASEAPPALDGLALLASDEAAREESAQDWVRPEIGRDTTAYLQYSSGSTGLPKGVVLTHGNVVDNLALIRANAYLGHSEGDTPPMVLWLPFFHDMGLVNGALYPLYAGSRAVHMTAAAFVQRPVSWLRAIAACGTATTVAPNFAYELCNRRVTPEQIAQLDLSGWELAGVGAEPVRAATLDRFAELMAPAGFRREAFFPCYGLAESTVMVSGGPSRQGPVMREFDAEELSAGRVRPARPGARARTLVASGQIQPVLTVEVVNPLTGTVLGDDRVGEIFVAGGSIGHAYWEAPEATAETFGLALPDRPGTAFLRTGDLGFVHEGQLYVTGRRKDAIIVNGLNHYPHDLENSVARCHPAIREDRCCVCAVEDGERERVVAFVEIQRRYRVVGPDDEPADGDTGAVSSVLRDVAAAEIEAAVRAAVSADHAVRVDEVVLLRSGALPYTSSAKIKRAECRSRFLSGAFAPDRLA